LTLTNSEIRCAMYGAQARDMDIEVTYLQGIKVQVERMTDSYQRGHWLWHARTIITREVLRRELDALNDSSQVVRLRG
jgi:hypothetical protein